VIRAGADRSPAGVLLAAGTSSRFGSDKLLHPLADGTPIVLRSARTLLAALPRSVAVVRDRDGAVAQMLERAGLGIVECRSQPPGMGASIACGVSATRYADGWVIALADMPFVGPAAVEAVASALRAGAPLAAPWCRGRRGHPVGFADRFGHSLTGLTGDAGARGILDGHAAEVRRLPWEDEGVLRDIDVPADL
jgi:molybdenum cofactor cytidylyltransferase